KLPVPGQGGDRRSPRVAGGQPAVGRELSLGQLASELQVEVEALQAERVGEQHFSIESRRGRSVRLEVTGGSLEDLQQGQLETPASCSARSAAIRASTISSSSPCITRSSL